MTANTPRCVKLASSSTRVHGNRLADDEAIGDEFPDGLTGVGIGDLVDFVRVEPDLATAAAHDGRRKAFLGAKIDPNKAIILAYFVSFQG
jgi:hypothetical protein